MIIIGYNHLVTIGYNQVKQCLKPHANINYNSMPILVTTPCQYWLQLHGNIGYNAMLLLVTTPCQYWLKLHANICYNCIELLDKWRKIYVCQCKIITGILISFLFMCYLEKT